MSNNQRKPLAEAAEAVEEEDGVAGPDVERRKTTMAIRELDEKHQAVAVALLVDFATKVEDDAAGFPHRG